MQGWSSDDDVEDAQGANGAQRAESGAPQDSLASKVHEPVNVELPDVW